jgi:hypothetical protein
MAVGPPPPAMSLISERLATPAHLEDLDVPDVTFTSPDLTTFCRLEELGLEAVGQRLDSDRAVRACRVVAPDQ